MRLHTIDEEAEWINVYESIASRLHQIATPVMDQSTSREISQSVFNYLERLRKDHMSKYINVVSAAHEYGAMDSSMKRAGLKKIGQLLVHEN